MYQTKFGLEISANGLQMTTSFKSVEGVQLCLGDPLVFLTLPYINIDNYFLTRFNNDNEVLISVTNGRCAGAEVNIGKLTQKSLF